MKRVNAIFVLTRWLSTKAEEPLTCPWYGDYTTTGIKLVFQGVSGIKESGKKAVGISFVLG